MVDFWGVSLPPPQRPVNNPGSNQGKPGHNVTNRARRVAPGCTRSSHDVRIVPIVPNHADARWYGLIALHMKVMRPVCLRLGAGTVSLDWLGCLTRTMSWHADIGPAYARVHTTRDTNEPRGAGTRRYLRTRRGRGFGHTRTTWKTYASTVYRTDRAAFAIAFAPAQTSLASALLPPLRAPDGALTRGNRRFVHIFQTNPRFFWTPSLQVRGLRPSGGCLFCPDSKTVALTVRNRYP